jgi:hypothetical protein
MTAIFSSTAISVILRTMPEGDQIEFSADMMNKLRDRLKADIQKKSAEKKDRAGKNSRVRALICVHG